MAPGIIVLAMAANRVAEAARHPSLGTVAPALGLVGVIVLGLYFLGRWLARTSRED
jgi:hypothetical protein